MCTRRAGRLLLNGTLLICVLVIEQIRRPFGVCELALAGHLDANHLHPLRRRSREFREGGSRPTSIRQTVGAHPLAIGARGLTQLNERRIDDNRLLLLLLRLLCRGRLCLLGSRCSRFGLLLLCGLCLCRLYLDLLLINHLLSGLEVLRC